MDSLWLVLRGLENLPITVIQGAESGSCGGVAGARSIVEKTMGIVLGPVISTPKSGEPDRQTKGQRLSDKLGLC